MKWFFSFCCIFSVPLISQNLVKNGGFEKTDFWKCVTGIPNPNNPSDIYGRPSFAMGTLFSNISGSNRLYSTLVSNTNSDSCSIKCGAPFTVFGYKMPHSGNNFSFHPLSTKYFQLVQPLIKNQQYVFECYLSSANYYHTVKPFYYNLNSDSTKGFLSINFNKDTTAMPIGNNAWYNNLLINNITRIDTVGWTKISTCFTAKDTALVFDFWTNIYAFIDDIAIYPANNFNSIISQKPCESTCTFSLTSANPNFMYYYNVSNGVNVETNQNPYSYNYEVPGTYYNQIISKDTITKQFFCTTNTVTINSVKADFIMPHNMVTEVTYTAINTSLNANQYHWRLNYESLSNNTFSSTFLQNELCLVASNTLSGCSDTLCKIYDLEDCGKITDANIFTPNFDKINDAFYFFDIEPCDTTNIQIWVYDRWGKEHYHYPDYGLIKLQAQPSLLIEKEMRYTWRLWNGYQNNIGSKFADAGVYYYIIESNKRKKTGIIQVFK